MERRPAAPAPTAIPAPRAEENTPPLRYAPAENAGEGEEFGFEESAVAWPSLQRRQRSRMVRFVVCELLAILVLVMSAMTGLSHRSPNDSLSVVARILTIASAIAAVGVPILFYGLPETLPRTRR